jgi:hypothetical protein
LVRKDGREKVQDGTLDLHPDVYNGMVLTVLKNLSGGAGETVHMVAFTPAPKLIKLKLAPEGEQKIVLSMTPGPSLYLFSQLLFAFP